MVTKSANAVIPVPAVFHTVYEAARTLHNVREQGQTVTVEYNCSDVRIWVTPYPVSCMELDTVIREGRAWSLGALFADVSIECGGTGWFDINLYDAQPEVIQAVAAAIEQFYANDRRADVRSALRAIYRRIT